MHEVFERQIYGPVNCFGLKTNENLQRPPISNFNFVTTTCGTYSVCVLEYFTKMCMCMSMWTCISQRKIVLLWERIIIIERENTKFYMFLYVFLKFEK